MVLDSRVTYLLLIYQFEHIFRSALRLLQNTSATEEEATLIKNQLSITKDEPKIDLRLKNNCGNLVCAFSRLRFWVSVKGTYVINRDRLDFTVLDLSALLHYFRNKFVEGVQFGEIPGVKIFPLRNQNKLTVLQASIQMVEIYNYEIKFEFALPITEQQIEKCS